MIVIAGVAVIAAGAWVMPMYNAQLAHDDAQQIQNTVKDVKSIVNDVEDGLTGGKDLGKQNIVGLIASGKEKTELTSLFGDGFDEFNSAFLGSQNKAATGVAGVEFKTFSAPLKRTILPDNVDPTDVVEADANTCFTANTDLGSSTTVAQQILGFVVTDRTAGAVFVRVQVCANGGPLSGTMIIDEFVTLSAINVLFTKNFDFGVVPPNSDLQVYITTEPNTADTFDFWLLVGDPQSGKEIPTMQGLVGNPCTGATITVNGPTNAALATGTAIVELSHSSVPFHDSKPIGAGGQAFFPGPLPPGQYFIDVFPTDTAQFPVFDDVTCTSTTVNQNINIKNAGSLISAGSATLTVKVVDENGAPLTDTRSFVDHASLPVINDICNDASIGARATTTICADIPDGDALFTGGTTGLTDTAGQFSIAGLPVGNYFINTCTSKSSCGGAQVNLVTAGTTVTVEIFVN